VPLFPFELAPSPEPLPADVVAFLAGARRRIDAFFQAPGHLSGIGFIPSDYELVWRALRSFVEESPVRTFCEWGSGFGVVTGLAAMLGCDAHGIEVDGQLVAAARELLAAHRLQASFAHGSLVPDDYEPGTELADLETRTVLTAAAAYGDMALDLDDFELIFAYPGPTEEQLYCDLFLRFADYGAVLLTYSRTEGMRGYRKVGRG
jgi:hypothetical protein